SYNVEGGEPATLYDLARYDIKPLISRVPGVGRVGVQGSDVREIEVIADPARLAAHGLTYAALADGIRRAITVQAVGRVAQDNGYRRPDAAARCPRQTGVRPGATRPRSGAFGAGRDAHRRGARRPGAARVPAARPDHGDQRDLDSADAGNHSLRDAAAGADVQ